MPTIDDVRARCDAIEEGYEFMLAYAGQGLATDQGAPSGGQIRGFLHRFDEALTGLADLFRALVREGRFEAIDRYDAFIGVLERDARDAQAAVQLALAQASISSQLVDNLNASIHVRALLTDLFLIDEIAAHRSVPAARTSGS
jgi:hypothetical protein